jgi:hypothetical protein
MPLLCHSILEIRGEAPVGAVEPGQLPTPPLFLHEL